MKTITAEEYKKMYGEAGVTAFKQQESKKNVLERVGNVISTAGQNVQSAIAGEGQYRGESAVRRGTEATAEAFSAVPKVALAVAPEPVREGAEKAGEVVGRAFKSLTDFIGSTPELQKFVAENPKLAKALEETAGTLSAGGEIAGNILGAQGTASTLQKSANITKQATQSIATNSKDAFATLRPTTADIATERASKIRKGFEEQNTRLKSADAAYNKSTIVRKLPDGTEKTITPIDTFADNDIAPVIESGSIQMGDYKTGSGALGKIKEAVQKLDDEIDTQLVNTGKRITIQELEEQALKAVRDNDDFRQSGTVASNEAKVKARFEDYRNSYGDDIDIAELNNIRKVANRDWKPETQDTSRVIGDVARDYVHDAVPDNAIKQLLQKQGELLAAKKYAEKINGSKVTGGRLGSYAMRTAGAVLGSTVEKAPVIGPVAGMLGGEAVARLMQQSQFKSAWTELRSLIAKD